MLTLFVSQIIACGMLRLGRAMRSAHAIPAAALVAALLGVAPALMQGMQGRDAPRAERAAALTALARTLLRDEQWELAQARTREGLALVGPRTRRAASLRLVLAEIELRRGEYDACAAELNRVDWLLGPHVGPTNDRAQAQLLRGELEATQRQAASSLRRGDSHLATTASPAPT